jgi:hypothetical protein
MGADKNSFRRMNSAYVPNSQPRVPTGVFQGRVVTTDLPTLGTNPNSKQQRSATQKAKDLGDLHSLGQTVRMGQEDRPRGPGGPSASTGRTIRKCHWNFQYYTSKTDRLSSTRGPSAPRGLSGLSSRTVRQTLCNQKHTTKRIERKANKNTRRTRRTAS